MVTFDDLAKVCGFMRRDLCRSRRQMPGRERLDKGNPLATVFRPNSIILERNPRRTTSLTPEEIYRHSCGGSWPEGSAAVFSGGIR